MLPHLGMPRCGCMLCGNALLRFYAGTCKLRRALLALSQLCGGIQCLHAVLCITPNHLQSRCRVALDAMQAVLHARLACCRAALGLRLLVP